MIASRILRPARWLAALLLVAGCQSPGPVDNPVGQSLTWFSYLDGQDIQAACLPGSPDRLRFIYNGTWDSQVRTYDILGVEGGAEVEARVLGQGNLADVQITGFNLLAPWDAQKAVTRQDEAWLQGLVQAMAASGFDLPPEQGNWLRSDSYYWVAIACLGGRYGWNAWASDWSRSSPHFIARVRFVDPLLQADATGVPYSPPQRQPLSPWGSGSGRPQGFRLQIQGDGVDIGPQL